MDREEEPQPRVAKMMLTASISLAPESLTVKSCTSKRRRSHENAGTIPGSWDRTWALLSWSPLVTWMQLLKGGDQAAGVEA